MRRHEPVHQLCDLIESLPISTDDKTTVLFEAAMALGIRMQRTGLPLEPERRMGTLFWDHETKDIKRELLRRLDPEQEPQYIGKIRFLVLGVFACIRFSFEMMGNREHMLSNLDFHQSLIARMEKLKALPQSKRPNPSNETDVQIDGVIAMSKRVIETLETRRESAERALEIIDHAYLGRFSISFWRDFQDADLADLFDDDADDLDIV